MINVYIFYTVDIKRFELEDAKTATSTIEYHIINSIKLI